MGAELGREASRLNVGGCGGGVKDGRGANCCTATDILSYHALEGKSEEFFNLQSSLELQLLSMSLGSLWPSIGEVKKILANFPV